MGCSGIRTITMVVAVLLSGCVDLVSLENRVPPCLEGYKNCPEERICQPQEMSCAHGEPCVPDCISGEYCFHALVTDLGQCFLCVNNKHCGSTCLNCTDANNNWACVDGSCSCRGPGDCPADQRCSEEKVCQKEISDGGMFDSGGSEPGLSELESGGDGSGDSSVGDSGQGDGGLEDASTDAGIDPTCNNNKRCGAQCQDCTQLKGNWACLNHQCGCHELSDCQPNQKCENQQCIEK